VRESHTGPILIADITGYSRYLNESELVHAEQTLSALMEVLVEQTRPPLVVSKLEGDAVFSYGLSPTGLQGQAFVESIEACYVEFRRALELMVINTNCPCNACANISSLDLKFVVHYGEFVVGEIAGRKELHGREVNLLHRLLKNDVASDTGITAYAMFTQDAVEALNLASLTEGMTQHRGDYADVGEVVAWVEDLRTVWERSKTDRVATASDDEFPIDSTTTVSIPIDVVWSYLLDIEFRQILVGSDNMELRDGRQGRAGEGAEYRCWHGGRETRQLIVDWRPLERIVTRDTTKMGGANFTFQAEYLLKPVSDGTELTQRASVVEGPLGVKALMKRLFPRLMSAQFQRHIDAFGKAIEESYARRLESKEVGL
jgi:class 3 adenylate cyclase